MRIVAKGDVAFDIEDGLRVNGTLPSWCDVEVFADNGAPIKEVKSIQINWTEGTAPLTATIEVYVSEVDVQCKESG